MTAKTKFVSTLVIVIIALDQASKVIVDRVMMLNHSIPVIENIFNLTYIRNKGAAFGIFAESSETFRLGFLVLFSVLAIGFIVKILSSLPQNEKGLITALSFILGGALGNLIDRLLYGEVIDFLDLYWSKYHWPAFNVADSFITMGVLFIVYRLLRSGGADPFSSAEA
ncbi:MAG: signal peptidase II [Deltaproteobacteria bacterium]|nr:signal peptidase II [Deltaproteobacteria bacterium]